MNLLNRISFSFVVFFSFLFVSLISNENEKFRLPLFENAQNNGYQNAYLETWQWPWDSSDKKGEQEEEIIPYSPFIPENLHGLKRRLKEKIVGQDNPIHITVSALERYVLGIHDPSKPIASLLFVGPTGVGKTLLAKELARELGGEKEHLIHLNMAEYSESSSIYRLTGSPLGYIEHEAGGQFTGALKDNPFAIVLLDEVEKASQNILMLLLQLFDEGCIRDSRGSLIDCRNSLFILTTNIGESKILTMHELGQGNQAILTAIQPDLVYSLSSELYNRLDPVIFRGLNESVQEELIQKLLTHVHDELFSKWEIDVDFDSTVNHFIMTQGFEYRLGARPVVRFILQSVKSAITEAIMQKTLQQGDKASISCDGNTLRIWQADRVDPFIWKWEDCREGVRPPFQARTLLNLEEKIQESIFGQTYAVKLTVAALKRYMAGLSNQKAPIGAFLYVGPTGVGKTQLAKVLAKELMGSEERLIRLDMSEYSEPHSISRLIGSPPGYVNHDEGGQLTEQLKQSPYSIVLLDEIEKAHAVVLKTFLQVFDEGWLTDAKGTSIDCRNVVFIATTNLASKTILSLHHEGFSEESILDAIQDELALCLSPELYNRLEVAPFMGLGSDLMEALAWNLLKKLQADLWLDKGIEVQFDSSLIEFLKLHGYDYKLGARPLKRLFQQTVVTFIATHLLEESIKPGDCVEVFYHDNEVSFKGLIDSE